MKSNSPSGRFDCVSCDPVHNFSRLIVLPACGVRLHKILILKCLGRSQSKSILLYYCCRWTMVQKGPRSEPMERIPACNELFKGSAYLAIFHFLVELQAGLFATGSSNSINDASYHSKHFGDA